MKRTIIGGIVLAAVGAAIILVAVVIGSQEYGANTYDAAFGDTYQSCGTALSPRIDFAGPIKPETMAESCAPFTSDRTGALVVSIAAGAVLMGSGTTATGLALALRSLFAQARRGVRRGAEVA